MLHAPLELTARLALLPYLAPDHREAARLRLFSIAGQFDAFGPAVDEPTTTTDFDTAEAADARSWSRRSTPSDLEAVDAAAAWLGTHVDGARLRSLLADTIVPRLSAAAHGSILLYQLPRIAPRGEVTAELLRPLARELARYPDMATRIGPDGVSTAAVTEPEPGDRLFSALAATPQLGVPGSDFIFPVMSQVDDNGVAAEVLDRFGGATSIWPSGARAILRAAAWSMLAEPETHVPYGWTHCLTLPQAVLGVAGSCANPRAALAVAATYVVGFRAAFAAEPLVADVRRTGAAPRPRDRVAIQAGRGGRGRLARGPMADADIVTELASRAAVHVDAHFVKYTLACIDAAHFDPTHARLYLAAAAATRLVLGDPVAAIRREPERPRRRPRSRRGRAPGGSRRRRRHPPTRSPCRRTPDASGTG